MNFNERIAEYGKNIEEALENAINIPSLAQKEIFEAMSYSLNGGGKRIRPMLLLEFARVSGANNEAEIMPFACAIEMVHTYSLIHDDLPCMDDDELRRGRATNHIVFGEAIAVLAGDGLLNYAYEFMIKNSCFSADVTLTAVKALADAAGVYGMLGGQVIDMDGEGRALDATEITNLHRLKTGALIRAACEIGCIL
ncbi:MAG: polyprenyl synthetase family protein, partial [Clostridia bacterium]